MSEFAQVLTLPRIGAHEATRQPRLKDGLRFLRALEAKASVADQLEGAREILLGMGFPETVVDDLPMAEAVEYATSFFSASLQRNGQP